MASVNAAAVAADDDAASDRKRCRVVDSLGLIFLIAFLFAGTILVAIPSFRTDLLSFLDWLRDHEAEGAVVYTHVFAVGAVLCFPEVRPSRVCGDGCGAADWGRVVS